MPAAYLHLIKQLLVAEKELLKDRAFDVANADTDHDYKDAKAKYEAQQCRVNAIEDVLKLVSDVKEAS